MHFCTECGNMYYIRLSEEDGKELVYYCRKCGNEDDDLSMDNLVVSKTNIISSDESFHHIINRYTKMDKTLPRITTIKCPNPECVCNQEGSGVEPEIIYLRYDNTNLKFVYLCVHCDYTWKTGQTV